MKFRDFESEIDNRNLSVKKEEDFCVKILYYNSLGATENYRNLANFRYTYTEATQFHSKNCFWKIMKMILIACDLRNKSNYRRYLSYALSHRSNASYDNVDAK